MPMREQNSGKRATRFSICHGRGRGFEPRRPRHTFQMSYREWAETIEGAKGHRFVSPLCSFYADSRRPPIASYAADLIPRADKTSDITAFCAACFDGVIAWV